ncbi:A/G-specific adenine glycosylase [Thermosynechococcaceae cyanobacterium BACA0444]|uniref:Adenine DNA glycosylase n=1 Tax=Pseudocalidococcus azoricus BACA0444 TaxID=2918990 RepID=A0AAE4FRR6_9CYAN|nr:A/G-specific adenine glycosylase [Pseudocalidococcus azoricus]MDS3861093.1 A/G-specific adenine glycosylase [Pseudocalidococcus azoricus BACA0444]
MATVQDSAGRYSSSSLPVPQLRQALLGWYAECGRDLPWRQTQDPYAIWISEIMLQQTQVQTVIPYYHRWLEAFPNISTLAQASQQQVLKLWQGLGYYARARNLHTAAQKILSEHDGQFPQGLEAVMDLPGIGRTTAGGILSAAFNQPQPILDGNVKRVLARLYALKQPPQKVVKLLWQLSSNLLDPVAPCEFNQALMDLGATICLPKNPQCPACPWLNYCQAHQQNLVKNIPMTTPSQPIPHKIIGVAVIWNSQNQVLIDRRPADGLLGGLWEFPGGKVEPNETIPACIQREIQEEIGIEIVVGDELIRVDHAYSHFKVTLVVHHCQYLSGDPQPLACEEVRWVTVAELNDYPFPKANEKIITALLAQARGDEHH